MSKEQLKILSPEDKSAKAGGAGAERTEIGRKSEDRQAIIESAKGCISQIKKIQANRSLEELDAEELKKVLALYKEIKNIAAPETSPSSPEFAKAKAELIRSKKEALKKYFGREIPVPPLPAEITAEQFEFWKKNQLKLHYIPDIEIAKDNKFPGQKEKLSNKIYQLIIENNISKDSARLPEGWTLVDERPKPNLPQEYEDDLLAPALEQLRKDGQIEKGSVGSRFNISCDELNKPAVKVALAEALNVKPEQISLPKAVLWNYLGNAFHPEWGKTNTLEWFEDEYGTGGRLDGGDSVFGGLANVACSSSGLWRDYLGFRPSVRFSK